MSQFKFLNLDSKDSTYSSQTTNNSYAFDGSSSTKAPNSYNTEWNLRIPINNPRRIWLKSIEIPLAFSNIRSSNLSNTITVSTSYTGGTQYTITIPDKTYSSIQILLDDINAAFLSTYPTVNIIFSINTIAADYGFVKITTSSSAIFTSGIFVQKGMLASTILGFTFQRDDAPMLTKVASCMYLLNADNYINLWIKNLSSNDCNNNGVPSSFKIPLVSVNGSVMYSGSNIGFDSYINVNSVTVISKIQIVITDRWGYSINSRGLDYSLTLAIEM